MPEPGNHLNSLLNRWRSDPDTGGNLAAWKILPARPADLAPLPADLHPALSQALAERGIGSLYSHQAAAWDLLQAGLNIVLVTGTASGKTLAYNLPVLDRLQRDRDARALYLFPTKALAQDQLDELHTMNKFTGLEGLIPATYDGDTPNQNRPAIRKRASLVISNPDMLHTGILPHHTAWAEFFRGLQFVIIDEVHTYRGVFGSHVANVLRRLRRVARFYGASPQFILTSATIANPGEFTQKLIEAPVTVIDQDGAPRGEKHFLVYNPPVIDQALGLRKSLIQETVRLASEVLHYQLQAIVFARTRRTVELILSYLRQNEGHSEAEQRIRGYRSGYLPRQRRRIEQALRQGEAQLVVATTALELGIDIGDLHAAILAGYPGTIASTWQQAGRAGRGQLPALTVLVTSANPLDQFLARHPEYLFERTPEQALINPDNLLILLGHLRCAAFELPFQPGDSYGDLDPAHLKEFLDFLVQDHALHQSGGKYFWMADAYPAQGISLRSASAETITLQNESGQVIGQVDRPSALWMVHPGAVYLHEAQLFQVRELDLEGQVAHLQSMDLDYYTNPKSVTTVTSLGTPQLSEIPGGSKAFGDIQVTTQVVGFQRVRWFSNEMLGFEPLSLPPSDLVTTGYWLAVSDQAVTALQEKGLWNSSPNEYGSQWIAIRNRVRARDAYRCQNCGVEEAGRQHDVHHKIPFRAFLDAAQANQLSNLVTLCPNCHRLAETAVRIRSGLAGVAYVLGNLAPLFLMCDARDLGVHSDFQAPFADGKPAVVLYDHVPAGIGFSERLYNLHSILIGEAYNLVQACSCEDGCPSCVGPGGENGYGGKLEATALLESLCQP
jgi:DEAD/DEAH box helicase domain-containing protein